MHHLFLLVDVVYSKTNRCRRTLPYNCRAGIIVVRDTMTDNSR